MYFQEKLDKTCRDYINFRNKLIEDESVKYLDYSGDDINNLQLIRYDFNSDIALAKKDSILPIFYIKESFDNKNSSFTFEVKRCYLGDKL